MGRPRRRRRLLGEHVTGGARVAATDGGITEAPDTARGTVDTLGAAADGDGRVVLGFRGDLLGGKLILTDAQAQTLTDRLATAAESLDTSDA